MDHNYVVVSNLFFMFTPILGEMVHFDSYLFRLAQPPPSSTYIYNTVQYHALIWESCFFFNIYPSQKTLVSSLDQGGVHRFGG